jgi:glycosyltransferase involved in cell wall biosynthesis
MISCLLVTKNKDKFPYLKRALKSYIDQTYKDKELVIVCGNEQFTEMIKKYVIVNSIENCQIHYIEEDRYCYTLGDMRNISIEYAKGDITVNWDDDDINHPERLETQYNFLKNNNLDACFMSDQLHYFYDTNEIFWVDWGEGIPGTLMCYKKCFNTSRHPSKSFHEDSELKGDLIDNFKVGMLRGVGYLYLYSYNGLGVFKRDHHINEIINRKDLKYMKDLSMKIRAINYIKYYELQNYSFDITKLY